MSVKTPSEVNKPKSGKRSGNTCFQTNATCGTTGGASGPSLPESVGAGAGVGMGGQEVERSQGRSEAGTFRWRTSHREGS